MSWKKADEVRASFTRAQEAVLARVFCTSCQLMKATEGGGYRATANGRRRFACAQCQEKATTKQRSGAR